MDCTLGNSTLYVLNYHSALGIFIMMPSIFFKIKTDIKDVLTWIDMVMTVKLENNSSCWEANAYGCWATKGIYLRDTAITLHSTKLYQILCNDSLSFSSTPPSLVCFCIAETEKLTITFHVSFIARIYGVLTRILVGRRQVEVIFLQLCLKQEPRGSGWAFQGDPLCRCHNAVASVVGAARAAAASDSRLQVWGCALGFNGTSGGLDDSHSSSPCEKPVII